MKCDIVRELARWGLAQMVIRSKPTRLTLSFLLLATVNTLQNVITVVRVYYWYCYALEEKNLLTVHRLFVTFVGYELIAFHCPCL